MANDSTVNLKMVFEILTDKEVEELKQRARLSAEFLRRKSAAVGSRGAIPGDGEASLSPPFVRRKEGRVMLGGTIENVLRMDSKCVT